MSSDQYLSPIILAVGCKSRVGKDTFIDYISSKWPSITVRFAEPLYNAMYNVQSAINKSHTKQPAILQSLGESLRKVYGEHVFSDIAKLKIQSHLQDTHIKFILIPDLRHKSEYRMLYDLGAIMVRIERPDRPIDRDPTHISEVDLDGYPMDYCLVNSDSLSQFYAKIDLLIEQILSSPMIDDI